MKRASRSPENELPDFQLGPFTRALLALHLAPRGRQAFGRIATTMAAALWLAFLVCSLLDLWSSGKIPPLFKDVSAHVRVLVSIPALMLAERIHHERSAYVTGRLTDGGVIGEMDRQTMTEIVASAERLRHSRAVEYAFWGLGFGFGLFVLFRSTGVSRPLPYAVAGPSKIAFAWYAVVVVPLYAFLFARAAWRWLVWSRLLFQVSRANIRWAPTHPDRAGGLGFLSEPVSGAAVAAFAVSACMIARWRTEAMAAHASIREFAASFAMLFLCAMVLAIGPLLFFSPPAFRARLRAEREHSRLVLGYVQQVREAWFEQSPQHESPIGDFDSSSMADIDTTFQNLLRMRLVPVEPKMLVAMAVGLSFPFAVSLAAEIPLSELLRTVGHALTRTLF